MWLSEGGAVVLRNTILFNRGYAPEFDGAGGICLVNTDPGVLIEANILSHNDEGAVRTYPDFGPTGGTIRWNIMFENGQEDLRDDGGGLMIQENMFLDPLLCVPSEDTRGELDVKSPALHSPYGVIGAVEHPSCDDGVRALPSTWGRLKARY
jgi:hypothetical protein